MSSLTSKIKKIVQMRRAVRKKLKRNSISPLVKRLKLT
jgi:hypothetical protein